MPLPLRPGQEDPSTFASSWVEYPEPADSFWLQPTMAFGINVFNSLRRVRFVLTAIGLIVLAFFNRSAVRIRETATQKKSKHLNRTILLQEPAHACNIKDEEDIVESINSNNNNSTCRYEQAIGHFDKTFSQRNEETMGLPWQWVSDEAGCPVTDFFGRLIDDQRTRRQQEPITILLIGDSLERKTVEYICETLVTKKEDPFHWIDPHSKRDDVLANRGEKAWNGAALCSDGATTIAHFKIFGMDRPCNYDDHARNVDNRWDNTTAERIERLLPHDILDHVQKGPIVTVVGSCLWDLSLGCNDMLDMDPDYLDDYGKGMVRNHRALQKLGLGERVFWRTCHPVTKSYSEGRPGRNLSNQKMLSRRMLEIVEREKLGVVVDWWKMIHHHAPDEHVDMVDGRHYSRGAIHALMNMFLNSAFDHFPELEIGPFFEPTTSTAVGNR